MLVADGVPAARAVVVNEGIDLERVDAAPPAQPARGALAAAHAPIVGNVAALVPHKGQRHLIEAAAHRRPAGARRAVRHRRRRRAAPALERQIREQHLEKHVFLAGFRPDVLSLHKAFDLFVMSSVTEGLGTSLLDAMACGKPVVATAAGGIPEVVEDGVTGLLVPPRDHEAMAARDRPLLNDAGLRRQMGEAAILSVRERFSVERMVLDTLRVYQRVAMHEHREDNRESRRKSG